MAAITTTGAGHHGAEDPNESFLAKKGNGGIMSWLVTLDHKRIGIMYLASVSIAFALGGTHFCGLSFGEFVQTYQFWVRLFFIRRRYLVFGPRLFSERSPGLFRDVDFLI